MLQAKNCYLDLPTGTQDYIRFGNGPKTLLSVCRLSADNQTEQT